MASFPALQNRGSRRQLATWLELTSQRRATWETDEPGARVCATIRRLSSSDHDCRYRLFFTHGHQRPLSAQESLRRGENLQGRRGRTLTKYMTILIEIRSPLP